MKKINLKKVTKKAIHSIKMIGSDADKDWKIFFSLFVSVLIISISIHMQIFFGIESDKQSGAALEAKRTSLINSAALTDLLSQYDKRAENYAAISTSTSILVDPSR
jgi:predicted permease